jgi:hypothetical protein
MSHEGGTHHVVGFALPAFNEVALAKVNTLIRAALPQRQMHYANSDCRISATGRLAPVRAADRPFQRPHKGGARDNFRRALGRRRGLCGRYYFVPQRDATPSASHGLGR